MIRQTEHPTLFRRVLIDFVYRLAEDDEKNDIIYSFGANRISVEGQNVFDTYFEEYEGKYAEPINFCTESLYDRSRSLMAVEDEYILDQWREIKQWLFKDTATVAVCSIMDAHGNKTVDLNAYHFTLLMYTAHYCLMLYRFSLLNAVWTRERVVNMYSKFACELDNFVATTAFKNNTGHNVHPFVTLANCVFIFASIRICCGVIKKSLFTYMLCVVDHCN